MSIKVELLGEEYEVIDSLNNITLADSFLKNKTGTGHGEAKLYVGNESTNLFDFFENFSSGKAILLKKDLLSFLSSVKDEYIKPQQRYYKTRRVNGVEVSDDVTSEMPLRWQQLDTLVENQSDSLNFDFFRSDIAPPRVYINSNSENYTLLREIGIPNISYISILKLKDNKDNTIFYFKPFVNYSNDIIGYVYPTPQEENEIATIEENSKYTAKKKSTLVCSRIGQGKYREKLLDEMPYCPFTKISDERLLIASHMKPWVKSNDSEKINSKNGLMLSPTYDVLFDKGFITFEDNGKLIVSPFISPMNQKRLNIHTGKQIGIEIFFDKERLNYLEYHREHIYMGV